MRTELRIAAILMSALVLILAGCGDEEETAAPEKGEQAESATDYEDGVYFAQANEFSESSGWKDVVVLEVEDGEITMVDWNAAHEQNGRPKEIRSRQGDYGMVANSDATRYWYEQAESVEEWLLENQNIDELELNDEGRPDAISGATINAGGFKSLVQEALAEGPVGYGMWEDGTYSAEQAEFSDNGWKAAVGITVIGGRIVAAEWDSSQRGRGVQVRSLARGRVRHGREYRCNRPLARTGQRDRAVARGEPGSHGAITER